MNDWLSALADLQHQGQPCVLVTIIEEQGSTPRNAGSKMVVSTTATFDTIGGGHLEYKATQIATCSPAASRAPAWSASASAPASASAVAARRCCCSNRWGGCRRKSPCSARAMSAARWSRCSPCRVRWIDSREQEFPALIPDGVRKIVSDEPLEEIDHLPTGSYCVIMTHNHPLDLELSAALLKRNDFTYFGLIGSKTKRVKFEHRLRERGFDNAALQRMRCPMGLAEVKGKLPVEIAISIAGEIIATYNANFGQHSASAEPIAKLLPASRRSQATH